MSQDEGLETIPLVYYLKSRMIWLYEAWLGVPSNLSWMALGWKEDDQDNISWPCACIWNSCWLWESETYRWVHGEPIHTCKVQRGFELAITRTLNPIWSRGSRARHAISFLFFLKGYTITPCQLWWSLAIVSTPCRLGFSVARDVFLCICGTWGYGSK